NNVVQGNYIGTDITGTLDFGNTQGINISAGDNTVIGGSTATPGQAPGNVISASGVFGNGSDNVELSNDASGAQFSGNIIGLNAQGTAVLGNFGCGILIRNSSNIIVGGGTPDPRNVISGNTFGIQGGDGTASPVTNNNRVQGNYLGTNINGTADLGN